MLFFLFISQALGCMLYQMLCLRPAFDAQNLVSLFYKIVKADFEVAVIDDHSSPCIVNSFQFLFLKKILITFLATRQVVDRLNFHSNDFGICFTKKVTYIHSIRMSL